MDGYMEKETVIIEGKEVELDMESIDEEFFDDEFDGFDDGLDECSDNSFDNRYSSDYFTIFAKVKKEYEGLFRKINDALKIVNNIEFSYGFGNSRPEYFLEVLASIDLKEKTVNFKNLVNELVNKRGLSDNKLINAVNISGVAGSVMEEFKRAIVTHEKVSGLLGDVLCNRLNDSIQSFSVECRKADVLFLMKICKNSFITDFKQVGIILETFAENSISVRKDNYDAEINECDFEKFITEKYGTEYELGKSLLIKYKKNKKLQVIRVPLIDAAKTYNVRIKSVHKFLDSKLFNYLYESLKIYDKKIGIKDLDKYQEYMRLSTIDMDYIHNIAFWEIINNSTISIYELNTEDDKELKEILNAKGLNGEIIDSDLRLYIDDISQLKGNVVILSSDINDKEMSMEFNMSGDTLEAIIDDIKLLSGNSKKLECYIDNKLVFSKNESDAE